MSHLFLLKPGSHYSPKQSDPLQSKMVGLGGNPPVETSTSGGQSSKASQTCDHKCAVITLSITIPVLALLTISLVLFGLLQRRRAKRNQKSKDGETEIAMRKLGSDSETSSVTESFGNPHAVTNLEDDAEVTGELEKPSRSLDPGKLTSKTIGWWKI